MTFSTIHVSYLVLTSDYSSHGPLATESSSWRYIGRMLLIYERRYMQQSALTTPVLRQHESESRQSQDLRVGGPRPIPWTPSSKSRCIVRKRTADMPTNQLETSKTAPRWGTYSSIWYMYTWGCVCGGLFRKVEAEVEKGGDWGVGMGYVWR